MARAVRCEAKRLREAFGSRRCSLDRNKTLVHKVTGLLGPAGISPIAADLLDVAAAVYRCERLLPVAGSTNRYTSFHLSMPLRDLTRWTDSTVMTLSQLLEVLGNAKWTFDFWAASASIPTHNTVESADKKERVVLFSGGLDSTCGLASNKKKSGETLLSSYYTRQKTRQSKIASILGYDGLVQWSLPPISGPGRSFFYRSFYFLSLGAVVAESWRIRQLVQFETGVLAYAIPPSPWYAMTKHAHPKFLSLASQLYKQLFGGGGWSIENPFIHLTKREEVKAASKDVGANAAKELFTMTETCWSHWACHVYGRKKKPGVACGVCIPCIIRRTAIPCDSFQIDLTKTSNQNHEKIGQAFRSYLAFLEGVLNCASSDRFYKLLPSHLSQIAPGSPELKNVYRLFIRFGNEFVQTFFP